jgi:peptidoglycan/xylan/chitin deacetylase (PgdA/CDA1 family)
LTSVAWIAGDAIHFRRPRLVGQNARRLSFGGHSHPQGVIKRGAKPNRNFCAIKDKQRLSRQESGRYVWEKERHRMKTIPQLKLLLAVLALTGIDLVWAAGYPGPTTKPAPPVSKTEKSLRSSSEIERGPRGKSQIAITFDAGANAECFDDLITALESAHVHSTFFITGNFAQRNVECAKAITKHGHELGNHTWNHADLTKQPDDIVREELTRAEMLLTEISGQSPRPRFRAPFGARDNRVLRIAANLGYRSIYWTIDSLDSVEPRKSPEFLIDRITGKTDAELDGAIILMHVGEKSTADALPAIITNLQGRGFRLVTVSKLLATDPKRN